jgi:hypothetical protein
MHLRIAISVMFLLTACGWGSEALASSNHQHGEHQTVSPFNKKQDTLSAHCLLNNHHHDGFCPHSRLPDKDSSIPKIAVDCGGKGAEGIPSNSSNNKNHFALSNFYENPVLSFSSGMTAISPFYAPYHSDLLIPPPRFI